MSAEPIRSAPDEDEYITLHRLVNHLSPAQARVTRQMLQLVVHETAGATDGSDDTTPQADYVDGPVVRDLPWIGVLHAEQDLAERHDHYIHEAMKHGPR